MKSFAILALGAGAAMAQSLSDLPQCGQTCITNMVNIASSEFGCTAGDVVCYCTKLDFGYGVRDCANEACTNGESGQVIAYGTNYCAGALASASTSGAALGPLTSALATETNTAGATGTGASGAESTAITTEALVATVTSDGSTFVTTTGFSTVYSSIAGDASSALSSINSAASSVTGSLASEASSVSGSLASAASSVSGSLASEASSVHASITGAVSSALSSGASRAASLASSLASGATGAPSTAGAAPMMTGLPFAGAAGMAAWLLL